jgi:flagellar basal-body rod modification protein FlgD
MSDVVGINDSSVSSYTTSTVSSGNLDKDDFLQLLVTQLKYQDPSTPLDSQALVSQLAEFSSLETLNNIQTSLESALVLDQSLNNTYITSLIGKDVHAYGDTVRYEGSSLDLEYNLAADADVTVTVKDEDGNVVRTIEAGNQTKGDQSIAWDGMNDYGETVEDGKYTFEVTATDDAGSTVTAYTYVNGSVEGITFVSGSPYLVVNGANINLGDVISVLGATDSGSSGSTTTDSTGDGTSRAMSLVSMFRRWAGGNYDQSGL